MEQISNAMYRSSASFVRKVRVCGVLLVYLGAFHIYTLIAEGKPEAVILMIDLMQVQQKAKIYRSIQQSVEKKMSAYKAFMQKTHQRFEKQHKALMDKKDTLSKEMFTKQYQHLQRSMAEAREKLRLQHEKLDAQYRQAMRLMQDHVRGFVKTLMQEKKALAVLHKEAVWASSEPVEDITKRAIQFLDQNLAQLKIKL